jgi:PPOX class probable F420-dependent enzyme
MASQRAAITMTNDEVAAFLSESRTAILTTIGPDGVPDPVPMWFVMDDDILWMRTYGKSQKVTNLERDPRAAILIETGERYVELRGVQLTGALVIDRDIDQICRVFVGLMMKYEGLDPDFADDAAQAYRPTAQKQVALACDWRQWRIASWDHRKQSGAD